MKKECSLLTLLTVCTAVGCGPKDIAKVEIPIPTGDEIVIKTDHQRTTLQAEKAVKSPTSLGFKIPSAEAKPTEVCRQFINLLNSELSQHFELLLTPAALNTISRSDFHLPPIADSGTTFELSEPQFGSIRQKVCFVDCKFAADSDGEGASFKWMLRKDSTGWRIAGMITENEDGAWGNLLSFENASDILEIKTSLLPSREISMN